MDITKLLSDLSLHNVSKFEGYGIKVEFHCQINKQISNPEPVLKVNSNKISQDEIPIDAGMAQMPDTEFNFDKVLHWSSSPDPLEGETPMTGDNAPLTSEGL